LSSLLNGVTARARSVSEGYAPGRGRPLAGYFTAMTVYGISVSTLGAIARAQRRTAPDLTPFDVVLVAAATHKLARLIAKASITSALRAPFTRYISPDGPAELHEEVPGHGLRHAVGELITCPFCLAVWLATGFTFGFVFAPPATRLVATTMTAVAAADFLQFGYAWAQQNAEG
jgi:hypothetical protein